MTAGQHYPPLFIIYQYLLLELTRAAAWSQATEQLDSVPRCAPKLSGELCNCEWPRPAQWAWPNHTLNIKDAWIWIVSNNFSTPANLCFTSSNITQSHLWFAASRLQLHMLSLVG